MGIVSGEGTRFVHPWHAELSADAHGAMQFCMWHKDQKSVCAYVLAILIEA